MADIINSSCYNALSEEEKSYALKSWTHIDFLIYNKITKEPFLSIEVDGHKYHKKGTQQAERDMLKNHVLKICNIPLLRLSTTGSGEKEKIIDCLKNIKIDKTENIIYNNT
jgi:Protein of unknown function (DUF2726).